MLCSIEGGECQRAHKDCQFESRKGRGHRLFPGLNRQEKAEDCGFASFPSAFLQSGKASKNLWEQCPPGGELEDLCSQLPEAKALDHRKLEIQNLRGREGKA